MLSESKFVGELILRGPSSEVKYVVSPVSEVKYVVSPVITEESTGNRERKNPPRIPILPYGDKLNLLTRPHQRGRFLFPVPHFGKLRALLNEN